MATPVQYALLSSQVYRDLRPNNDNVLPLPQGWSSFIPYQPSGLNGFSAGAYSNGSEIVISYAGTDFDDWRITGDWVTNALAGTGIAPASQIASAAIYYSQVKLANTAGLPIRFTGHSLGGGLASIMAVFFGKEATIFATAPFEKSATFLIASFVQQTLFSLGRADPDLGNFIANPPALFSERERKVSHVYISDEIVGLVRAALPTIVNPLAEDKLELTGSLLNISERHSIDLHVAFLASPTFRELSVAFPRLLQDMFDEELFGKRLQSNDENLLARLLRNQFGSESEGVPNAQTLDKFVADLLKLKTGYFAGQSVLRDALAVACMEYYYVKKPTATTSLFSESGGALNFNLSDFGAPAGTILKSVTRLREALETLSPREESCAINGVRHHLIPNNKWGQTPFNS